MNRPSRLGKWLALGVLSLGLVAFLTVFVWQYLVFGRYEDEEAMKKLAVDFGRQEEFRTGMGEPSLHGLLECLRAARNLAEDASHSLHRVVRGDVASPHGEEDSPDIHLTHPLRHPQAKTFFHHFQLRVQGRGDKCELILHRRRRLPVRRERLARMGAENRDGVGDPPLAECRFDLVTPLLLRLGERQDDTPD
jgi:hypothetical protein